MKFHICGGIATIQANARDAHEFYTASMLGIPYIIQETLQADIQDLANEIVDLRDKVQGKRSTPTDDLVQVPISPLPDRVVRISSSLPLALELELTALLTEYKDIDAWSPADMLGISTDLISLLES